MQIYMYWYIFNYVDTLISSKYLVKALTLQLSAVVQAKVKYLIWFLLFL